MHDRPICLNCDKKIETNAEMVFEAPCGHDACGSAVFHPICLMEWRDLRKAFEERIQEIRRRWVEEHEGGREDG